MKEIHIGVSERGCCWGIIENGKVLEEGEFELEGKKLRRDRRARWDKEKGVVVRNENGDEVIYDGFFLIIREDKTGEILTNVFGKAKIYPVDYYPFLVSLLSLTDEERNVLVSKLDDLVNNFIEKYIEKEE